MSTHLSKEYERVLRNDSHCTLCMLDIDHFKQVNDNYGHTVGDTVLRGIIEADHALLCAKSRGRNRICRWED